MSGLLAGLFLSGQVLAQPLPEPQKVITLEGPSETPPALFVQDLLGLAYKNLGYRIEYSPIPLGRSFVEANAGRIDGLRARVGTVADKYPNLIKVPYRILDFRVVVVGDRRTCGACDLSQVQRVVIPRGFKAFGDLIGDARRALDIVEVSGDLVALDMLKSGKVDVAVVSDVNVPERFFDDNPHWIKHTLAVLPDYHYLHKKHQDLARELYFELTTLDEQGVVKKLQDKYGVQPIYQDPSQRQFKDINAISGEWAGFTDSEQGTYWRIFDSVFNQNTHAVDHEVTNWKRAKQIFAEGNADILVGAYGFEVGEGMLRADLHIDYEVPVTAYGKDKDTLTKQLAGELPATACYRIGYDFVQWLPDNIKPYESATPIDCRRLLMADRVDIMVDYEPDVSAETKAQLHAVDIKEGHPLFVVFHDTHRGRALKIIFEKEFRRLILSGKVSSLFPNPSQYAQARLEVKP